MRNKRIFLSAAVLVFALATIQSAAEISIESGANADVTSSGGSASGGQFLEDNSHIPTPDDFDRSIKWSVLAGIYADASIPEGETGRASYRFSAAKTISWTPSSGSDHPIVDIGYDGTVMAKVSKESLEGSAEAHSRVDATGTRYYSGEGSYSDTSGMARIFSEISHTGVGTALAEATGTASYSVPSGYPFVKGMASGRTSVSSSCKGTMNAYSSHRLHGIAEISGSSLSGGANDPYPWAEIHTRSTIYSNVDAGRDWDTGITYADVHGSAQGKASGNTYYPTTIDTKSIGTVKTSVTLTPLDMYEGDGKSDSKDITSSKDWSWSSL